MIRTELLEQLAKDVKMLKSEIAEIKMNVEELHYDAHNVKPGYLRKLKKIEKGKFKTYSDIKQLRKAIENV